MRRTRFNLLSATAIALFVTACGDANQNPNTNTTNQQTLKSIGQEIRAVNPTILGAIKPLSLNNVPNDWLKLALMETRTRNLILLKNKATSETEKDLLSLQIANDELIKVTLEAGAPTEKYKTIVDKLSEEEAIFFNKYIQSTSLREAVIIMSNAQNEIVYLEHLLLEKLRKGGAYTQEKEQIAAATKKLDDLKETLTSISEQAQSSLPLAAELEALGIIGYLTKAKAAEEEVSAQANRLDLGSTTSLRRMRTGGSEGHADLTAFNLNGNAGGLHALPKNVYLQLNGAVNTLKNQSNLTGVAAYKINNTLVGIIHGHTNTHPGSATTHTVHETSAVVSQSVGNAFIEAQAGVIAGNAQGNRAMLSLGYDFKYVTPFIQALYRNTHNTNHYCAYAGIEADVLNFATHAYTTTFNLNIKGGYNQNSAFVGQLAASASLTLNNGLGISNNLTLNEKLSPTVELGLSYAY